MCFSKYFLRRSLPNGIFEVFGNTNKTLDDFLIQNKIVKGLYENSGFPNKSTPFKGKLKIIK